MDLIIHNSNDMQSYYRTICCISCQEKSQKAVTNSLYEQKTAGKIVYAVPFDLVCEGRIGSLIVRQGEKIQQERRAYEKTEIL